MRIAISGSACQGKTTLINDFLTYWDNYKTPEKSYRDVLGDKHSKDTTEDTQWNVLNHMVDSLQEYRKGDNVIFDRCPLDNIVYSMWAHEKGNVSKEFIDKCIPLVKESMKFLDIIFFTPITRHAKVEVVDDNIRETDEKYIKEIDAIFKTINQYYYQDLGPFFPKDDKPAIIEIFGDRAERIEMIKLYLDDDGDAIGEGGILNPEEIASLEEQFRDINYVDPTNIKGLDH